MVTMLHLQQDDSYIAKLQRENAQAHLKDVEDRKLRMRLPKAISILAAIAMVLGCGMTTVAGLAAQDIIAGGDELINPDDPLEEYLPITYLVEGEGYLEGETDQLVLPGEDTTPVVAVPEDGWVFTGWDDGGKSPERFEENVQSGAVYIALFEEIGEDGEGGEGDGEGQNGDNNNQEGDQAADVPAGGENNSDSQQGGQGNEGSGQGSDNDKENGGTGEGEEKGEGKGDGKGNGAGGKWDESNQFLDGTQYYGDHKDEYYQWAQDYMDENGDIPPEMQEFFKNYFNGI